MNFNERLLIILLPNSGNLLALLASVSLSKKPENYQRKNQLIIHVFKNTFCDVITKFTKEPAITKNESGRRLNLSSREPLEDEML